MQNKKISKISNVGYIFTLRGKDQEMTENNFMKKKNLKYGHQKYIEEKINMNEWKNSNEDPVINEVMEKQFSVENNFFNFIK